MSIHDDIRRKIVPNEPLLEEVRLLIAEGHNTTLIVRGNSMNPMLVDRRDKVILSPFSNEQLQPGAVVLAQIDGNTYVLHRIIRRVTSTQGKEYDTLILKGDGNSIGTERTTPRQVAGIATAFIRKGQHLACSSQLWHYYSVLWMHSNPLRRYLLAFYRRIINRHIYSH